MYFTAIRNELLYSGFVLPNVQIFFVLKISFATFGVSIDDFFTRYAGVGYSLYMGHMKTVKPQNVAFDQGLHCLLTESSIRI